MGEDLHRLEIESVDDWCARLAQVLGDAVERATARTNRCILAVSADNEHLSALRELAARPLDWDQVVLVPTHELLVIDDDARLLPGLQAVFDGLPVTWLPLPADEVVACRANPEATADDRESTILAALDRFDRRLVALAGQPPVIDVSHLGLGADGHTAALFATDPVLGELRRYSAVTALHDERRYLTLTRPVFDRCRVAVWAAAGVERAASLGRLLMGDLSLPAGTIRPQTSIIVADTDAARQV